MNYVSLQRWMIGTLIYIVLLAGCTVQAAAPVVVTTSFSAAEAATAVPPVPTSDEPTPTPFLLPTFIPTPVPPTATATPLPTPTATPPAKTLSPAPQGIWISPEELALRPMGGPAWNRLVAAADRELEAPNLASFDSDHDVYTFAAALLYARTGDEIYREKAAEAIRSAMGTEHTGRRDGQGSARGALAIIIGRNLAAYVIAADLIGLADYDPELEAAFRAWINELRHEEWDDRTLIYNDEARANHHGRMAGASRAAIAAYLKDEAELARAARKEEEKK